MEELTKVVWLAVWEAPSEAVLRAPFLPEDEPQRDLEGRRSYSTVEGTAPHYDSVETPTVRAAISDAALPSR
jgi:hypothetical protein